jgi:hypothetical protein
MMMTMKEEGLETGRVAGEEDDADAAVKKTHGERKNRDDGERRCHDEAAQPMPPAESIIEHVVHNIHLVIQTRGELSAGDVVISHCLDVTSQLVARTKSNSAHALLQDKACASPRQGADRATIERHQQSR